MTKTITIELESRKANECNEYVTAWVPEVDGAYRGFEAQTEVKAVALATIFALRREADELEKFPYRPSLEIVAFVTRWR